MRCRAGAAPVCYCLVVAVARIPSTSSLSSHPPSGHHQQALSSPFGNVVPLPDAFSSLEPRIAALEALDLNSFVEDATAALNERGPIVDLDRIESQARLFLEGLSSPPPSDPSLEHELLDLASSSSPSEVVGSRGRRRRLKRSFTVEFNGVQVSYPSYLRLRRLQSKVMKLHRIIQYFQSRYTEDQLREHEDYLTLKRIYNTLRPLLPPQYLTDEERAQTSASVYEGIASNAMAKRSAPVDAVQVDDETDGDFLGVDVSGAQFSRLAKAQEKAVMLDLLLYSISSRYPPQVLELIPLWQELKSLHESVQELLPEEYTARFSEEGDDASSLEEGGENEGELYNLLEEDRGKRAAFNGMSVTAGEYARLMSMQRQALKLDAVMRQMVDSVGRDKLQGEDKWQQLVKLRKSLQKVMPSGAGEFKAKRSVDFNGIKVSYPTYLRLMEMQKKMHKLDVLMAEISKVKTKQELDLNPEWKKLKLLRATLAAKLLPKKK